MSTEAPPAPPVVTTEPPKYYREAASGVALAVFSFGFSILALSLSNAEIVKTEASLFVPVALGTGALGMLVGGIWEFYNGNVFGATFGVAYAAFLFTTGIILRWFAPEISAADVAGVGGFGDTFGAYLLMWAVFTAGLTIGAYYINLPAFLAFALLTLVYLLAGIVNISQPSSETLIHIAGWAGILDGLCAWWLGMAIVLNAVTPRPIVPLPSYPYGMR